MAKALFIVANNGFQDNEFGIPYKTLTAQGHYCDIASGKGGRCGGVFGTEIQETKKLEEVNPNEYDILIFIGGGGAENQYSNNERYLELAKNGKAVAAICIAPTLLSYSGIFEGKEVTGWDDGNKTQINQIENNGGIFKHEEVVQDGKIITANGPDAATKFAWKLVDYLKNIEN